MDEEKSKEEKKHFIVNSQTGGVEYITDADIKKFKIKNGISLFFFYIFIIVVVVAGVFLTYDDMHTVYLAADTVNVQTGNNYQIELVPKVNDFFSYDNYIYEVSDNKIATVSEYGEIKALSEGNTSVSIRFKNGIKKETMLLKVSNIKIDKMKVDSNVVVNKGDTEKVKVIINDDDSISASLTYKSSNEDVFKVDEFGNITGVGEGEATLSISSSNGIEEQTKVSVVTINDVIKEINISEQNLKLRKGDTKRLTLVVTPANASLNGVKWESSNTNVITVDNLGNIKTISEGTSIVNVKTSDGLGAKSVVTVEGEPEIVLNTYNENIKIDDVITLKANMGVTWTSSDTSVATIDGSGVVTGKGIGTAIMTATSASGKKATCQINVANIEIAPAKIAINEKSVSLVEGETKKLSLTYIPEDTLNKAVTWSSSDSSIASVDDNGLVTAKKAGSAKITVYLNADSTIKSEVVVNVTAKNIAVTSIVLNKNSDVLYTGSMLTLVATVMPNNATDKGVTWYSSDTSIATVDASGKVTAKKAGTVQIRAVTTNQKTATCDVIVKQQNIPVSKITINSNVTSVYVGESISLQATIEPSNATNKGVTWSSSDTSIATVDASGKVTGKKNGSVKITATSKSNSKIFGSKSIVVSTKAIAVTKLAMSSTTLSLPIGSTKKLTVTITPTNATNKKITWSSSNASIASVDQSGNVKAVAIGSATITAKSANGITATSKVTVTKKPVTIKIATFNIGYYRCGSSNIHCVITANTVSDLIKNNNINIIGMQECEPQSETSRLWQLTGMNTFYEKADYYHASQSDTILSSYDFIDKSIIRLPRCGGEERIIQKIIVKINGTNISIYNTHFAWEPECSATHFKAMADLVAKETNPSILLGDMNIIGGDLYNKYYKPLGYVIAARDTSSKNLWNGPSYCDTVYVKGNGKISIKNGTYVQTYGTYSDHNMTVATLDIY